MAVTYHKVIDHYFNLIELNPDYFCREQKLMKYWLEPILDEAFIDKGIIDSHLDFTREYVPFKMLAWEDFMLAIIFGVKHDDEYKDPIFNEFLIKMGRGGGKNGFMSVLALNLISNRHLTSEGKKTRDYDITLVANTEDQAKTSFNEIREWINNDKKLASAIYDTRTRIEFKSTSSEITYSTSNPRSGDGGRPGAVIFDEIHEYENWKLINVHTGGLGKGNKFARRFYITTDGYVRNGVIDDLKAKSKDILNNEKDHNGFFPFILKLDAKEEAKDKTKWVKANHLMKYNRNTKIELEKKYQDALENPSQMEDFMTKRMNIPVISPHRTVASVEDIKATAREVEVPKGSLCIGAIDFSSLSDFTACGLMFRVGDDCVIKHHSFVYEGALELTEFNFPIKEARAKGLCTIVPKSEYPVIPAYMIRDWFIKQADDYSIMKIVADSYRISALRDSFSELGLEIEEVRSGFVTDGKLYPEISQMFAENRICYGDYPMMRWYTNNTMVETDKKGNKRFLKIDPIKRKNDGFSMFIHAFNFWHDLPREYSFDWGVF